MNRILLDRGNTSLLRGLHYFEAVARNRSVKLAASELGVSQSAVSHQLRQLSETLGEQLWIRTGRGIALTPTGERLSQKLASTFGGLQAAVDDVIGGTRHTLRLAVCSSFGPGWLVERLNDFYAVNPEIDLQICLYAQDPELTDTVADAFVTAVPILPGFEGFHVIDEFLVAVHAPSHSKSGLHKPRRLITTELDDGKLGSDWSDYCACASLTLEQIRQGPWLQCTHYMLASEMAKAGLGVALIPDFLARRDVEDGRLAYFDKTRMPSGRTYNLCFKQRRAQEQGIQVLAKWFRTQIEPSPKARLFKIGAAR